MDILSSIIECILHANVLIVNGLAQMMSENPKIFGSLLEILIIILIVQTVRVVRLKSQILEATDKLAGFQPVVLSNVKGEEKEESFPSWTILILGCVILIILLFFASQ